MSAVTLHTQQYITLKTRIEEEHNGYIKLYLPWAVVLCGKLFEGPLFPFRYRDKSVHLHECSPFWVGIFVTFIKETYQVYCFM